MQVFCIPKLNSLIFHLYVSICIPFSCLMHSSLHGLSIVNKQGREKHARLGFVFLQIIARSLLLKLCGRASIHVKRIVSKRRLIKKISVLPYVPNIVAFTVDKIFN